WADLMATVGQFCWPSVGTFVAAYGQFFMAANSAVQTTSDIPCRRLLKMTEGPAYGHRSLHR
ncbi:hypothetical protein, partial [Pseudarthrobacter oxydans]|uniref:hypothetical protein n=1 Tax=Pseudarthrobacter oxydans TaxID=1671 RepID=UPI003809DDF6